MMTAVTWMNEGTGAVPEDEKQRVGNCVGQYAGRLLGGGHLQVSLQRISSRYVVSLLDIAPTQQSPAEWSTETLKRELQEFLDKECQP